MKMFLIAFVAMVFAAQGVYSQTCHMREVDLCMATGMFHYQSNGVPKNEEEVDEWCETIKDVQDCMKNYTNKCMSPLQQELLSVLNGGEDIALQMCTPGDELRTMYLKHAQCVSEAAESEDFQYNLKNLQVALESVFEAPFKQRYSMICCGLKRFHMDIERGTEEQCGKEAVRMVRAIWTMVTNDLSDVLCERYDAEDEQCVKILPVRGTPAKGAESKSQVGRLLDTVFGTL